MIFSFDPRQGRLDFTPGSGPGIRQAGMRIRYIHAGKLVERALSGWQPLAAAPQPLPPHAENGPAFACPADASGMAARLYFALAGDATLYWKLVIENEGRLPVELLQLDLLDGEMPLEVDADTGVYFNGWQSWSPAAVYGARDRMLHSKLGFFQRPMIDNPGTPVYRRAGLFASDFYGAVIDRHARTALLAGFLSQMQHFGTLSVDLRSGAYLCLWANGDRTRLDPGAQMETDWAVLHSIANIDQPDPFGAYLDACAEFHGVRVPQNVPVGWCSWYHYYQNVTEQDIRSNLNALVDLRAHLPVDLLQIDDGFEAQIGDWFEPHARFPQGVAGLAQEIKAAGMQPGLWLAPFIVHPRSRLASEHPDWLLRRLDGRPARGGWVWNALQYGLDLTVPEALDYACRVVHTAVEEWGYPYLKLDFLYAAALRGHFHDPTRTRAQVLRAGMAALRQAAGPETFMLGCGAPFGSCLGLVDAMRIGADVSGDYYPNVYGFRSIFKEEPSVPCLVNGIRNTLNRAALHRRWWLNDPDCLLVRPDTALSEVEVRSWAAVILLTGGMLLISDDMAKLPPERRAIFEKLLPLVGERPWVLDGLDENMPTRLRLDLPEGGMLLGAFNWDDFPRKVALHPADFRLSGDSYPATDFWTDEALPNLDAAGLSCTLPAHGSLIFKTA